MSRVSSRSESLLGELQQLYTALELTYAHILMENKRFVIPVVVEVTCKPSALLGQRDEGQQ